MKIGSRQWSRLAVVSVLPLSLMVLFAPTTAASPAGPEVVAGVPAEKVSAESLGVDASTATGPWRMEETADGKRTLLMGAIDDVPMGKGVVRYADHTEFAATRQATEAAAAVNWVCTMTADGVTKAQGYLESGFSTICTGGRPGLMRAKWRWQRSSWSGYRPYIEERTGLGRAPRPRAATSTRDAGWEAGDLQLPGVDDSRGGSAGAYQGPATYSTTYRDACGTGIS